MQTSGAVFGSPQLWTNSFTGLTFSYGGNPHVRSSTKLDTVVSPRLGDSPCKRNARSSATRGSSPPLLRSAHAHNVRFSWRFGGEGLSPRRRRESPGRRR